MSTTVDCRHEDAAGRDFCPRCGAYLAWDIPDPSTKGLPRTAESAARAAGPPAGDPGDPPGLQPRLAALSLRDDERPEDPIVVPAGQSAIVHARVRNQSKIVDEFILAVEGLEDGWWDIQPPALYLLPFGVGRRSSYEGEARVTVKPPRSHRATAGVWPIRITVSSQATGKKKVVADLALKLDVQPYREVQLTVAPEYSIDRRRGEFNFDVENTGNKMISVVLAGTSAADDCRLRFDPPALELPPGVKKTSRVTAEAKRRHTFGRPKDHVLTLFATAPGSDGAHDAGPVSLRERVLAAATKQGRSAAGAELGKAETKAKKAIPTARISALAKTLGLQPPAVPGADSASPTAPGEPAPAEQDEAQRPPSVNCTYRQLPWLPQWIQLLLGLLLIAAVVVVVLLVLAWFARVRVPNVRRDYILVALSEVKKGHLDGVEHAQVPADPPGGRPKVGHVFAELPKPGVKVAPNSTVKLLTAVYPGTSVVPSVFGLTAEAAEHLLSKHGFAIGLVKPNPAPMGDVIVAQSLRPGMRVRLRKDKGVWQAQDKVVNVTLGQAAAVPNLTGLSPVKAQQMLRSEGLVLGALTPRNPPPSAVIATQSIAADTTIRAGNEIDVGLGLPVPKLKGAHLGQAQSRLEGARFRVGTVSPANPPTVDVVTRERPAGGTVQPFGTRVALTLAPPPKKKPAKKKAGAPAGSAVKPVPSVAGATAAAAAAAVAAAGDKTRNTYAISDKVPAGKLLGTVPAAGAKVAKGGTVTLVISAGFPEIAVDDGHRILALNGVTGKVLARVVAGPQAATEPSWSPSGADIAYVSEGRIMVTPARGPSGPRPLTGGGPPFSLPTFPATSSAPAVLAAIRRPAGRPEELCLLAVAHPRPSCLSVPGWNLGREIAWSPHGTEFLVGVSKSSASPGTIGLMEFTSRTPFSTRARSWGSGHLVTPAVGGAGVAAAAFSPNGAHLALAEDLGGPFSLALVAPSDLMLTKANTFAAPSPACSVTWRADSRDVLVQTSSAADCSTRAGSVYVVDPAHPRSLSLIATGVGGAVWQPLPGVG